MVQKCTQRTGMHDREVPEMRQAPEGDYLKIKAAWRRLVHMAGGAKHVIEAGITRGSESRMSEAGAPNHMDRFAALDQVLDLEMECGSPVVTQALADLHGFDLVQRDAVRPIGIHAHFARIIRETRDVELKMAEAMADGQISETERSEIITETMEAINVLQAMLGELRTKGFKVVGK